MDRRSDVSVPELEAAGNGLLDRRIFLKQGVALLSAGSLVAAAAGAARAAEPPGAPSPGAGMSDYGHPAPHESKVKRTLIRSQPGTTGSGASRTPLQLTAARPAVYHKLEVMEEGNHVHIHPDGTRHLHGTVTEAGRDPRQIRGPDDTARARGSPQTDARAGGGGSELPWRHDAA